MLRIGISSSEKELGEYGKAIERRDARPVPFRLDPAAITEQLHGIDGIVLSGGGDVDPQLYGCSTTAAQDVAPHRDAFEIGLLHEARKREIPTLCICRQRHGGIKP